MEERRMNIKVIFITHPWTTVFGWFGHSVRRRGDKRVQMKNHTFLQPHDTFWVIT